MDSHEAANDSIVCRVRNIRQAHAPPAKLTSYLTPTPCSCEFYRKGVSGNRLVPSRSERPQQQSLYRHCRQMQAFLKLFGTREARSGAGRSSALILCTGAQQAPRTRVVSAHRRGLPPTFAHSNTRQTVVSPLSILHPRKPASHLFHQRRSKEDKPW